jgi:hypothetical protein
MLTKVWPEKYDPSFPIVLVDSATRTGISVMGAQVYTFPVALWEGGVQTVADTRGMSGLRGTGRTGTGIVYNFDSVKIPTSPSADASKSWRSDGAIVWASLFSAEWVAGGGRWFHGVPEGSEYTQWCIWLPVEHIRAIAQAVSTAGGGYGYVG